MGDKMNINTNMCVLADMTNSPRSRSTPSTTTGFSKSVMGSSVVASMSKPFVNGLEAHTPGCLECILVDLCTYVLCELHEILVPY